MFNYKVKTVPFKHTANTFPELKGYFTAIVEGGGSEVMKWKNAAHHNYSGQHLDKVHL